MNLDDFWRLMADSAEHGEDPDARFAWLEAHLLDRSPDEIADFQLLLEQAKRRADTWPMWHAAYLICDGLCSGDGFWYFQPWLVGLGRESFEKAVADPDALFDVPEVRRLMGRGTDERDDAEWPEWEALNSLAPSAYDQVTGLEEGIYDALEERGHTSRFDPAPPGASWDFEDPAEAAARFPRLSRVFPLTDRTERDRRDREAFERLLAERGQTEERFFAELPFRTPTT